MTPPAQPFTGKCAVVLGGTSGLGHAIALGLAAAGANVVASSRSADYTACAAAHIEALGRRTIAQPSDVTSRDSIRILRDKVLDEFGTIDILVNSAGITKRVPTLHCDEDTWDRIFDINLTGTLRSCQIFGETMLRQRAGRIINIASLGSFVGFHEVAAYCASKAAVASLTRSLAVEWATSGILVNAIAPGIFPTALNRAIIDSPRGVELLQRTPMGRFAQSHELVSTALYLASDHTTFTTGQVIVVDGGFLASGVNQ